MVLDTGSALSAADWTRPDAPERFALGAAEAVGRAGPGARRWVTVSRLNTRALRAGVASRAATGRRGDIAATIRAVDHMVAAHVLAYDLVRAGHPGARVAIGLDPLGFYELDGLPVDLLLGRSRGLGRHELGPWLEARRAAFSATVAAPAGPMGRLLRAWLTAAVAGERAFPRAVTAVYASASPRPVDAVAVGVAPTRPRALGELEQWELEPVTSARAAGPSWPGTRPGR